MVGNILGLDINDSFVSGVLLKCGMKTNHIVSCATISISEELDIADAVVALLATLGRPSVACITSIPTDLVSFRNLQMPFCDQKSIRKTLPFELENMLPYESDEIAIDFILGQSSSGTTDLLAASVATNWLSKRLTFLTECGLTPEAVDVRNVPVVTRLLRQDNTLNDGLYLEICHKKCTMVLFNDRRVVLVRSLSLDLTVLDESALHALGHAVQRTITSLRYDVGINCSPKKIFITGLPGSDPILPSFLNNFFALEVEIVDLYQEDLFNRNDKTKGQWNPNTMNNALALALRDNRQTGFNFSRGNFAVRKQLARFKREIFAGVVYAVVFLTILAVDATIDRSQLTNKMTTLDNQIKSIFTQTFPDIKRVVSPIKQMRIKMMELKKGRAGMPDAVSNIKVIDLLEDISKRIPPKLPLQINRMVVDQEAIILKGQTDTFNTVDNIKKELSASIYYDKVTIASANLARSGKGVKFELKLSRVGDDRN